MSFSDAYEGKGDLPPKMSFIRHKDGSLSVIDNCQPNQTPPLDIPVLSHNLLGGRPRRIWGKLPTKPSDSTPILKPITTEKTPLISTMSQLKEREKKQEQEREQSNRLIIRLKSQPVQLPPKPILPSQSLSSSESNGSIKFFKTQFDDYLHHGTSSLMISPSSSSLPPSYQMKELSQKNQEQVLLEEQIQDNHDLIECRTENIEEIVGEMKEIQEIMTDLNAMVQHQGEGIDNIEFFIEETEQHTEKATEEIQTASKHQKKYRKGLCWLSVGGVGSLATILLVLGLTKKLTPGK